MSPQRSEAETATSRKPRKRASDGGVDGSATRFSIQMTKERGRGRLSRRSDGAVAKAKAQTMDCCNNTWRDGRPATRAIQARARRGPVWPAPGLLARVDSQSESPGRRVGRIRRDGCTKDLPRRPIYQVAVESGRCKTQYIGWRMCFAGSRVAAASRKRRLDGPRDDKTNSH